MTGPAPDLTPGAGRDVEAALHEALREHRPNCADDDRFTRTRPKPMSAAERKELYLLCFECPIFEACHAYAVTTRPAAGYWAGKNFGTYERPRRKRAERSE